MISPEEYAEAVRRSIPAKLSIRAVDGEDIVLYEIHVGERLMARVEHDHAISFLDGVIMGVNLARRHDSST